MVWRSYARPKTILLCWLTLHHKILMWDNLLRRKRIGPGMCFLCKYEGESIEHLLIKCALTHKVWSIVPNMEQGLPR